MERYIMQCSMRQHNYLGTSMTGRSKQAKLSMASSSKDSNFLTPRDSLLTSATHLVMPTEDSQCDFKQHNIMNKAPPVRAIEVMKTRMWEIGK